MWRSNRLNFTNSASRLLEMSNYTSCYFYALAIHLGRLQLRKTQDCYCCRKQEDAQVLFSSDRSDYLYTGQLFDLRQTSGWLCYCFSTLHSKQIKLFSHLHPSSSNQSILNVQRTYSLLCLCLISHKNKCSFMGFNLKYQKSCFLF